MIVLQELTQRLYDKNPQQFQGSCLSYGLENNCFEFVWESDLSEMDFIRQNPQLQFEAHTLTSLYDTEPQWNKTQDNLISLFFQTNLPVDEIGLLNLSFEVREILDVTSLTHKIEASFPDVSSPEELSYSQYEQVENLCSFLNREPVWFVKEDEPNFSLALKLIFPLELEDPRTSFYDEDFVLEHRGEENDWSFSLLDLKLLGYDAQEVLEMYENLGKAVTIQEDSEEEFIPDKSSLVKDYGTVEDTLLGREVVYFKLGDNRIEYRYECKGKTAKEALEAYLNDVRKNTKSLGVSYNKFVKFSSDWKEVMTSKGSLQDRGMEASYISPKSIGSSITASKAHDSNVSRRTGKRS